MYWKNQTLSVSFFLKQNSAFYNNLEISHPSEKKIKCELFLILLFPQKLSPCREAVNFIEKL